MGISRSSLYYTHVLPQKDQYLKLDIIETIKKHNTYGHRRIALALNINKKRILRVMHKFNVKPIRSRAKKPNYHYQKNDLGIKNIIKSMCPIKPYVILATDFTYIKFKNHFLYLASVLDIYTREIVGYAVSLKHTKDLVLEAVKHAISRCEQLPMLIHSDQGAEYMSSAYLNHLNALGIQISASNPGSPWENGFKESFYSQFKLDLDVKNLDRLGSTPEAVEHIYRTIFYHNNVRIHTSLKTTPVDFRNKKLAEYSNVNCERIVSKEMGT